MSDGIQDTSGMRNSCSSMPIHFQIRTPRAALSPAMIRQRPTRSEINRFKQALSRLLKYANEHAREENQKNHVRDFLRDAFYAKSFEVNTKDNIDLVIHTGPKADNPVGVILEAKRPSNKTEMPTRDKPLAKALFELIFYYFEERVKSGNAELKHLVITKCKCFKIGY